MEARLWIQHSRVQSGWRNYSGIKVGRKWAWVIPAGRAKRVRLPRDVVDLALKTAHETLAPRRHRRAKDKPLPPAYTSAALAEAVRNDQELPDFLKRLSG